MSRAKSIVEAGRSAQHTPSSALGRFIDAMLQTFEDCRPGLSDREVGGGEQTAGRFFLELYERETTRLAEVIKEDEPHLSEAARSALLKEIDTLMRSVIVPAYVRLAVRFTPRERNDFYLLGEKLHGIERVGWGLAGILAGAFVIIAPFIPLWSKEWILPFMIAGLFFPNVRRYLALRRYESELNRLVARADRECHRIDIAYLMRGEPIDELSQLDKQTEDDAELRAKLAAASKKTEKEH